MPAKDKPGAQTKGFGESWGGLYKAIRTIAESPDFAHIENVFEKNRELDKEKEALRKAEEVNLRQIANLSQRIEDDRKQLDEQVSLLKTTEKRLQDAQKQADDAKKEVEKKNTELSATSENTTKLVGKLKKLEADKNSFESSAQDANKKLETVSAAKVQLESKSRSIMEELSEKSTRLSELEGMLAPMDSRSKAEVINDLNELSAEALHLVKDALYSDLGDTVCNDQSKWDSLRKHKVVDHPYELAVPSSNSPQAKHMRVAAALKVLAYHISEELFQPVYGFESGAEVHDLLADLIRVSPQREKFLRSAILAAMGDKTRRTNCMQRAKNVLDQVLPVMQPLLSGEKEKPFVERLKELCRRACLTWSRLQMQVIKIEWTLELDELEDSWDLLDLPEPTAKPKASNASTNGTASPGIQKSAPGRVGNGQTPNGSQPSGNGASKPRAPTEDLVVAVWPCFFYVRKDEDEPLRNGLAVSETQIKLAKSELATLKRSATSSHREVRQRARAMSGYGNRDAAEKIGNAKPYAS